MLARLRRIAAWLPIGFLVIMLCIGPRGRSAENGPTLNPTDGSAPFEKRPSDRLEIALVRLGFVAVITFFAFLTLPDREPIYERP